MAARKALVLLDDGIAELPSGDTLDGVASGGSGGGGGMASPHGAHRYWRVNVTLCTLAGNWPAIAELVFRDTPGGSALAVAASLAQAGTASGAFDGTISSVWLSSNRAFPSWIRADFGTAREVKEVQIASGNDYLNEHPRAFDVQYSDDGTVWTTAWQATSDPVWAVNQTRVFTDPGLTGGAALVPLYHSYRYSGNKLAAPASSEILFEHVATQKHRISAILSKFSVGTPPAASFVLTLKKNDVNIATITIATTGVATFAFTGSDTVSAGDVVSLHAPATADAAIARLRYTIDTVAPPALVSATRWRMRAITTAGTGNAFGMREMQLFDTVGGTDVEQVGAGDTAIASFSEPGFAATQAFNENTGDFWTSGGSGAPAGGHWIGVQFATAKAIVAMRVNTRSEFNESPTTYTIEYSNDGVTWTSVKTGGAIAGNIDVDITW